MGSQSHSQVQVLTPTRTFYISISRLNYIYKDICIVFIRTLNKDLHVLVLRFFSLSNLKIFFLLTMYLCGWWFNSVREVSPRRVIIWRSICCCCWFELWIVVLELFCASCVPRVEEEKNENQQINRRKSFVHKLCESDALLDSLSSSASTANQVTNQPTNSLTPTTPSSADPWKCTELRTRIMIMIISIMIDVLSVSFLTYKSLLLFHLHTYLCLCIFCIPPTICNPLPFFHFSLFLSISFSFFSEVLPTN